MKRYLQNSLSLKSPVALVMILTVAVVGASLLIGTLATDDVDIDVEPTFNVSSIDEPVPDQLLIRFREGVTSTAQENLLARHGAEEKDRIPQIDVIVLKVPEQARDNVRRALANNPMVEFVEENRYVDIEETVEPNDPRYRHQWSLPHTETNRAWTSTVGSSDVTIAILDTGVEPVDDLVDKITPGRNVVDDNNTTTDSHGHGTMAAGVAGAATNNEIHVASYCWNCQIMPVKILDGSSGTMSTLAKGITWAADNDADIISMSVSGASGTATVRNAAQYARDNDVVLVAAAGNQGGETKRYPAAYDEVIAVGGTDSRDQFYTWSNYGDWVTVAAPGINHSVTKSNQGSTFAGTSSATPAVAGIIGLLRSADPGANVNQIEQALFNYVDELPEQDDGKYIQYGRVNAHNSVLSLIDGDVSDPPDTTAPSVTITAPSDDDTVSGEIAIEADATDNVGVTKVEFYRGSTLMATDTNSPYSHYWNTEAVDDGEYTLSVRAYDAADNVGTDSITVVVDNTVDEPVDEEPPTTPTGLSVDSKTHESVTLNWNPSTDNVGVEGYEILRDGSLVAEVEDTTYIDAGLSASTEYGYSVRAFDAAGNVSDESSTLFVTTEAAPDTEAPEVTLTNPGDGALLSGMVSITASASDNVGVTKVEFYRGDTRIHTDTSSPYSYSWNTETVDDGEYTLSARAYDTAGNVGTSDTVNVTVDNSPEEDTEPPTAPANLEATSVDYNRVELDWDASTDNVGVAGYRVYRNGNWFATTSTPGYTDSSVSEQTDYTYYVIAYDTAGNLSDASNEVEVTTTASPDTEPPTAPELSATTTSSAVVLSWTESTDNVGVAGYYVQRDGHTIATTTSTSYTDSNVSYDTTYDYRVVAFDEAGNYAASNTVTVTTEPDENESSEPPTTPSNLRETNSHTQYINMAWDQSEGGVKGYRIYRDGEELVTVSSASTTSFGDNSVRPNTEYNYRVEAIGSGDATSELSNQLNSFSHRRR